MPITPPTDGYTANTGVYLTVQVYMPDPDPQGSGLVLAGEQGFSLDMIPGLIDEIVLSAVRWLKAQYPDATHYQVNQIYTGTRIVQPEPEEIPA